MAVIDDLVHVAGIAVVREFQRLGLVAAARNFAHTWQTLRENPPQSRVLMNFQI